MQNQLHHVLDTVILGVTTSITALGGLLLASTSPGDPNTIELLLFVLPLIGSLIVSGGLIMLNPTPETRRIVIGRGIIALFGGVLAPQVLAMMHPSLAAVAVKPVLLCSVGGLSSAIFFVLSKPFVAQLYKRSEGIAAREAERLEHRFSPKVKPTTAEMPVPPKN
ncbi:MAG: hypothetical protein KCHDKBKB_03041 [Elusimicrobia bacterium]|nr:hypothetical protein [Elusimicrobiota bacterium]